MPEQLLPLESPHPEPGGLSGGGSSELLQLRGGEGGASGGLEGGLGLVQSLDQRLLSLIER